MHMQNGNHVQRGCGWTVAFVMFLLIMGCLLVSDPRVITLGQHGRRMSWYSRRERRRDADDTSSDSEVDDDNIDFTPESSTYRWSQPEQPSPAYEHNTNAIHENTRRIWRGSEGFDRNQPVPKKPLRRTARVTRITDKSPSQ
jgi:hypothetical protein